jgi:hypothetical protein
MGEIFISYRREESAGHAGRISECLKAAFGQDRIFLDVDDILPGQVFPKVIQERIARCAVVLVVIGNRWLETLRARASGDQDYVSEEIATALRSNAAVIPVLVGGASIPNVAELPDTLSNLPQREWFDIRDKAFAEDTALLINKIKKLPGFEQHPAAELTGIWTAQMERRGHTFEIVLDLEVFGDNLYGMVEYPTGGGAILEAKLNGRRFSFHTSHIPQFDSKPATIRTEGELVGDQIRLITVTNGGIARGVASRQAQPSARPKSSS